jgi:hypothetical protein
VSSWKGDSTIETESTTVAPDMEPVNNGVTKRNDDRTAYEE